MSMWRCPSPQAEEQAQARRRRNTFCVARDGVGVSNKDMDRAFDQPEVEAALRAKKKILYEDNLAYLATHQELTEVVNGFISAVLTEKPKNITHFAMRYFQVMCFTRELGSPNKTTSSSSSSSSVSSTVEASEQSCLDCSSHSNSPLVSRSKSWSDDFERMMSNHCNQDAADCVEEEEIILDFEEENDEGEASSPTESLLSLSLSLPLQSEVEHGVAAPPTRSLASPHLTGIPLDSDQAGVFLAQDKEAASAPAPAPSSESAPLREEVAENLASHLAVKVGSELTVSCPSPLATLGNGYSPFAPCSSVDDCMLRQELQKEAAGVSTTLKAQPPLVIAGPSGVGKGSIINRLYQLFPGNQLAFSVSHTTRKPRDGEVDGVDYNFISEPEMREAIDRDEFIEWAEVHGNLYGTSYQSVDRVSREGGTCLLDIDVQGVKNVKKAMPGSRCIFILPPTPETLEKRLTNRGTEDKETIQRRLSAAKREMQEAKQSAHFDAFVVNDFLPAAVEEVAELIREWFL